MTINSLANFGIPGLNGDRSAVYQPVFPFKFRALFYNFGQTSEPAPYDMTRQIRVFPQPQQQNEAQTLYSYVSTVYVASRAEWQEMTVEFYDDITNSVMRRCEGQLSKQQNFFDQTTSRAGENYKFEMDLDLLGGGASAGGNVADPNIIRKWCFSGVWITANDYGQMAQDDKTPMNISLTLRYDNVVGFDQNGVRMGGFSHTGEIQGQQGALSTGTGGSSSLGISISGSAGPFAGGVTIAGGGVTVGGGLNA